MHELNRCGELRGTTDELARLARCSPDQLVAALTDLQNKLAAEVLQRNGSWVIANRRMKKEALRREKRVVAGSIGGSKAQANREANPYQNPDNDNDIGTDEARNKVRAFCTSEGIGEGDADWFFYHCEASGWTNNKEPIRDWKATVRTWWRTGYIFPSHKQKDRQRPLVFQRPDQSDRHPHYPVARAGPELTDEQVAKNKEVIAREKEKLRKQLGVA